MACTRDRIIDLIEYSKSLGIEVNIGKNKARGNKGFFKTNSKAYRIDISKGLSDDEILGVLVHELAHFVHYKYDKNLKSLEFMFGDKYTDFEDELIQLTVEAVPKKFAKDIFTQKVELKNNITELSKKIKISYPNIKLSDKKNKIEREIAALPYKYLLKYDCVKTFIGFIPKIYSIRNLKHDFPNIKQEHYDYITLCSLKRNLNRVNHKISTLNKYYNNPSELFARSVECYILKPERMSIIAPKLYSLYKENLQNINILSEIK